MREIDDSFTPLPPIGLVVCEDSGTMELYEQILCAAGCWVTSSSEGEAVEYALDLRPEIIIADVDSGRDSRARELLQQLHAEPKLARVPVIVVTAFDPDAIGSEPITSILQKPISAWVLLARIQELLALSGSIPENGNNIRRAVNAVVSHTERMSASEPDRQATGSRPGK